MQQLVPSYIDTPEVSISAAAYSLGCVMAALGVWSLMRCCVCVSAKWTFSLDSEKCTGVQTCSPLILNENNQVVEQPSTLRACPKTVSCATSCLAQKIWDEAMREINCVSGFLQCNFKNTALHCNNAVRLSLRDSLQKIYINHPLTTKKTLTDGYLR